MLAFLFSLPFGSRTAHTRAPILTVYTSYYVLPRKEVPFGGRDVTAPNFGGQPLPKNKQQGQHTPSIKALRRP